jgi:hypothetical protein
MNRLIGRIVNMFGVDLDKLQPDVVPTPTEQPTDIIVSPDTLRENRVPHWRIGKLVRFSKSALEAFVAALDGLLEHGRCRTMTPKDVRGIMRLGGTVLGTINTGPRVGPVVINEIRYHPAVGEEEFIELKNLTNGVVRLYDPNYPTNRQANYQDDHC